MHEREDAKQRPGGSVLKIAFFRSDWHISVMAYVFKSAYLGKYATEGNEILPKCSSDCLPYGGLKKSSLC